MEKPTLPNNDCGRLMDKSIQTHAARNSGRAFRPSISPCAADIVHSYEWNSERKNLLYLALKFTYAFAARGPWPCAGVMSRAPPRSKVGHRESTGLKAVNKKAQVSGAKGCDVVRCRSSAPLGTILDKIAMGLAIAAWHVRMRTISLLAADAFPLWPRTENRSCQRRLGNR